MLKNEKLFYFICVIAYFCGFLFFSNDPASEKTNKTLKRANGAGENPERYFPENFFAVIVVLTAVMTVLMIMAGAYHFLKSKKKSKKTPESGIEKPFRSKKRRFT